jgi:hypothetical protein
VHDNICEFRWSLKWLLSFSDKPACYIIDNGKELYFYVSEEEFVAY